METIKRKLESFDITTSRLFKHKRLDDLFITNGFEICFYNGKSAYDLKIYNPNVCLVIHTTIQEISSNDSIEEILVNIHTRTCGKDIKYSTKISINMSPFISGPNQLNNIISSYLNDAIDKFIEKLSKYYKKKGKK